MQEKNQEKIKILTVRLPTQLHKSAKVRFAALGITFQNFFETELKNFVGETHV